MVGSTPCRHRPVPCLPHPKAVAGLRATFHCVGLGLSRKYLRFIALFNNKMFVYQCTVSRGKQTDSQTLTARPIALEQAGGDRYFKTRLAQARLAGLPSLGNICSCICLQHQNTSAIRETRSKRTEHSCTFLVVRKREFLPI